MRILLAIVLLPLISLCLYLERKLPAILAMGIVSLSILGAYAQDPSYYHDDTLDSINTSVGDVDLDLNSGFVAVTGAVWGASSSIDSNFQNLAYSIATNEYNYVAQSNLNILATNEESQASNNFVGLGPVNSTNGPTVLRNTFSNYFFPNGGFYSPLLVTNSLAYMDLNPILSTPAIPISAFGGTKTFYWPETLAGEQTAYSGLGNIEHGSAFAGYVSTTVLVIWNFILAIWCFDWLQEQIDKTMAQRQIQGCRQAIPSGANVDSLTAAIYGVSITAAIAGVVATISGFAAGSGAGTGVISWMFNPSHFEGDLYAFFYPQILWNMVTAFLPLGEILASWFSYLAFRYLYGWPLFLGVRSLIMWFLS